MSNTIEIPVLHPAIDLQTCPIYQKEDETHYVVYIEYLKNMPFSVYSIHYIPHATNGPYWRLYSWDFECADNDPMDLIAYNSGSRGNENDIQAPHFVKKRSSVEIWLAKGLVLKGEPRNAKIITELKELENSFVTSTNPFEIAEEVPSIEYCPKCKSYSREYCSEHIYFDDNGDARYLGNHHYVNF